MALDLTNTTLKGSDARLQRHRDAVLRLATMVAFCCILAGVACGQNAAAITFDFFKFTNAYQADKLAPLLAEDFLLRRTYMTLSHDKNTFLNRYIPYSKACNGKYKVLKIIHNNEPRQFLVEDHSDYFKYLDIDCPTWIMTIATEDNRIKQVTVDTTASHRSYVTDMGAATVQFEAWLKATYPAETQEDRTQQAGILTKRLKEYARQRPKQE
jgi:hypothetical protein